MFICVAEATILTILVIVLRVEGLGILLPTMKNHMDKNMENYVETMFM